jgi:hypothetical protein
LQPEAAREDNFLLEAAGAAAAPSVLDDFRTRQPAIDPLALQDDEVLARDQPALFETADPGAAFSPPPSSSRIEPPAAPYHPSFGPGPVTAADTSGSRPSSSGLLAAVLVLGLLAGFGGGYWLWGRSADSAGSPVPAGREFSEQAVAPAPGAASAATSAPESTSAPGPERSSSASSGAPPAGASTAGAAPADRPVTPAAKPAAAPARARGTIVVRSTPTGAGVTINGRWRGRTPLTLDDLPYARYSVRVVQPGYAPVSETVALSAGEPSRSLSFRLRAQTAPRGAPRADAAPAGRPAAGGFTGSIYVDSRPRGAQVSINGKPVGVTPLRIPNVRIGAHVVRLELPDHRIWSSSARVTAGEESRVTGSLERIQ